MRIAEVLYKVCPKVYIYLRNPLYIPSCRPQPFPGRGDPVLYRLVAFCVAGGCGDFPIGLNKTYCIWCGMSSRLEKENEYGYVVFNGEKVSKNSVAKAVMGYRNEGRPGATALFGPAELGYACPVCGNENADRLYWSEYSGFIWCEECNLDFPSCLGVKYSPPAIGQEPLNDRERVELQTEIFLKTVSDAIERWRKQDDRGCDCD